MHELGTLVAFFAVAFVALMIALQVLARQRSRAWLGAKVPALPGALGHEVSRHDRALLYFFSPSCAACRTLTPGIRELQKKNDGVFAIDVTKELDLARALNVMATPSTVEVQAGVVTGYHLGAIPSEVLARFER